MDNKKKDADLAEVILQLRTQLEWLDLHGYSRAAIDVNNALDELEASGQTNGFAAP